MDDSHPSNGTRPSFLERLTSWLAREPDNREELLELLHASYENNLLDADGLSMIEGVMQVSEMQARDIMVPRAQMDVIDVNEPPDRFIPLVIETAHSRFPGHRRKQGRRARHPARQGPAALLRREEEFNVRDSCARRCSFPESKPLNVLLKEFRKPPQPHRHRRRRIRRRCRTDHHRGRA
jgi:magnesium and cobalt transporter